MGNREYSQRFPADLAPNPLTELLRERRSRGDRVLDLTESNPTRLGFECPPAVLALLVHPGGGVYEPDPRGLLAARKAVAGYYAAKGAPVDPEHIVLTASTSEGYSFLFKLLGDPGSSVLAPRPSYPLFAHLAELDGLKVEPYPLAFDGGRWRIDFDRLEAVLDRASDPRALIVVHPNNPTGSSLARNDASRLGALCRDRGLALIADEVFADYPLEPGPDRLGTLAGAGVEGASTFVLSGLSKVAALPQLKLAWIVARTGEATRDRLDLITDTYLSVGGPVQWGAERLLAAAPERRSAVAERLRDNLRRLRGWAGGVSGVDVLPVEGGWSVVLRMQTRRSDEELALALLEGPGVYLHPGYFFDFEEEGILVLSLLVRPDTLERGLEGIAAVLARV